MEGLNVRLHSLLFFTGIWKTLKMFEEGQNLIEVLILIINVAVEFRDRRH